ncbi:MAG: methyltransferase domain-containing protein [Pseudomonadota bacterium]|nr:methyltransferase domain-containing protein [Pseudomonadota bacterium]
MRITVNGETVDVTRYATYHARRFRMTLDLLKRLGGGRVLELGGHPWAMTALMADEPGLEVAGSVSAEEITAWPEDFPVQRHDYELGTPGGRTIRFTNYSANIERTSFTMDVSADIVIASEIIEHLVRAPHRMMLNINAWLPVGGRVVLTTPNGAHFTNPLRLKPRMPAYRDSIYGRHNYVYTMDGLADLVTTCGFAVEETTYWSPYPRGGASAIYDLFRRMPGSYMTQKFSQSLVVVARKTEDRATASRLPRVYVPGNMWELIDGVG